MKTPHAKKTGVTCCSPSHGAPIVRVTTSQSTATVNMPMHTPHRIMRSASSGSNAFHLSCRWRSRTSARKSAMSVLIRTVPDMNRPETRIIAPPAVQNACLLHITDELQQLHGMRTELLRELILHGLRSLDEAGLVDVVDDLHADRLQLVRRILFELQRHRRFFF